MAGVTDFPFRVLCKEFGASVVYSEFVSAHGIIRENIKTLKMIKFSEFWYSYCFIVFTSSVVKKNNEESGIKIMNTVILIINLVFSSSFLIAGNQLEHIKERLNNNLTSITNVIPNMYIFNYDGVFVDAPY